MNLCGHATMATVYALKTRGFLEDKTTITIEIKAGVFLIHIQTNEQNELSITMKQATSQFKAFAGSIDNLAYSLGISKEDIREDLPIAYGNTGIWTLLIPFQKLETFKRMQPNNKLFPSILKEMPKASL
ncbi:hypothetical protein CWS01_20820 [Niallia nealsonii]|uniref:Uncharacterized protein n=2 Tax=Niallia nealsonii TaxID=115979 RepID=A0A2N0YWW2_9BACI|nr:hypothetical protein CWS01_20820 [Niallia nealsonii]